MMYQVPPGPLTSETAAKLSKLLEEFGRRVPGASLGADLIDYRGGDFTNNIVPNTPFPVKLTDSDEGTPAFYAWTEQYSLDTGYAGWNDLPGGRSGTVTVRPAFTPNDEVIDITDEPVVWIGRAYIDPDTGEWVYVIVGTTGSGGSALTVETVDGTTLVIPNVNLIKIGAHLTLASSGAGEATINVNTASQTVVTNVVCNGDGTITATTASVLVVV